MPEIRERRDRLHTVADYLAILGKRPPRFEPGTRFEYADGNDANRNVARGIDGS